MSFVVGLRAKPVWEGKRFKVMSGSFIHHDGEEVVREWIDPGDVVAILPYTNVEFWLGYQPRELTGNYQLGLAAGKIDDGESPEAAAARELQEEFGITDATLRHWGSFYSSEGITSEKCHLFGATRFSNWDLRKLDETERIKTVRYPMHALDEAILRVSNAKAKIALLHLWQMQMRKAAYRAQSELEGLVEDFEAISGKYRYPEDYETFDWDSALP